MTRDIDRPARGRDPMQIAAARAARLPAIYRQRFLDLFERARVAAIRGDSRLELWIAQAWNTDDSVAMAGLIEGAASVHHNREQKKVIGR